MTVFFHKIGRFLPVFTGFYHLACILQKKDFLIEIHMCLNFTYPILDS